MNITHKLKEELEKTGFEDVTDFTFKVGIGNLGLQGLFIFR